MIPTDVSSVWALVGRMQLSRPQAKCGVTPTTHQELAIPIEDAALHGVVVSRHLVLHVARLHVNEAHNAIVAADGKRVSARLKGRGVARVGA